MINLEATVSFNPKEQLVPVTITIDCSCEAIELIEGGFELTSTQLDLFTVKVFSELDDEYKEIYQFNDDKDIAYFMVMGIPNFTQDNLTKMLEIASEKLWHKAMNLSEGDFEEARVDEY